MVIRADHEILLKKCQKLGLKVSGRTHIHTLKQKLIDSAGDVDELTRNESNQTPLAAVFASPPSLSMWLDNVQGILSTVRKGWSRFITPPVPFSSAQPQQLTQPPPYNFGHIDSERICSQGKVV